MNRPHVVETIKSLVHKSILVKEENLYKFNKNWETWVVHKRVPQYTNVSQGSTQKYTKSSTQKHTYKRKKETNTKEIATVVAEPKTSKFNQLGSEIIKAFEIVDPKNKTYYNNTTQRSACDYLLKEYGLEEVLKRITVLPKTNKVPFFPKINSPNDLKEKWVKLQDAVDTKRAEINSKKNYIL